MKKTLILLGVGCLGNTLTYAGELIETETAGTENSPVVQVADPKTKKPVTAKKVPDVFQGEEISVNESKELFPSTTAKSTPTYQVTSEQLDTRVNAITVDDFLRYAPSIHQRRRFIGDINALVGIRGSNILQTSHVGVYGDGIQLSNPVNVSFAGTPRWGILAPSEIDHTDILYGPFSAQYGGNSFGGVINLYSQLPEKFQADFNVTGTFQDLDRGGRKEALSGVRTFLSAGNRFDRFSIYGFYNHLENDGQPIDPIDVQAVTRANNGTRVTGGIPTLQPTGAAAILFGDNGTRHIDNNLFKLKAGYDLTDDLQARFTLAYEDFTSFNNEPLSLLRNAAGATVYSGLVNQNGLRFNVPNNAFGANRQDRQSLNYGLSLKGKISKNWSIDTAASYFDPFKDVSVASTFSPRDTRPDNTGQGQVTETSVYWATYDLKLATDNFLDRDDLSFFGGYQFVHGSTNAKIFNTSDFRQATRDSLRSDAGGQTQTNSVFSQLEWRFIKDWSITSGLRFDNWDSIGGHNRVTGSTVPSEFADRTASRISPKAALEFTPGPWTLRYSFAKAFRFPFAEELFSATNTFLSNNIPDPSLGPEDGIFHNFLVQYDIPRGYIQANLFYETIRNEIVSISQSFGGQNINTFQALGKTEAIGTELTFRQDRIFDLPVDILANGTYRSKEITENRASQDLVGNEFARIPALQANASVTYHIVPVWDASVGVRYRSNIFQRFENNDVVSNVFNGSDEYTFVDLRTNYQLPLHPKLKSVISAGIDNLLNQDVYENNPLTQRSYYISLSLKY